jgi:streptomycin 6-kinase
VTLDLVGSGAHSADRQRWVDGLPALHRAVLERWELAPDGEAMAGSCSLVFPVLTAEGQPAVLKLGWPHPEAEHEHLALRHWAGRGAVRLIRADPRHHVLLLERAGNGRDLSVRSDIEACLAVAGLYRLLHIAAPPQLRLLSEQAADWGTRLRRLPRTAPVPRRYVEQAAALASDFAVDADSDGRLVHADLHFDNVLAGTTQAWLAIDPKPLSGDPHFEVAPLLHNRWEELAATGSLRTAIRARFHTVVDAADLDEDRARDWVVVRELVTVLWALHDDDPPDELAATVTRAVTVAKAVQD